MAESWRRLGILLLFVGLMTASEGPRVVLSHVDGALQVGDAIELEILYAWPQGADLVDEPDPARAFSGLVLTESTHLGRAAVGGEVQDRWRIGVVVPRSGAWSLPRPGFRFRIGDGSVVAVTAEETILQVGASGDEPELEPPRPVWERADAGAEAGGWPWWAWALLVGGIAGVIAATIAVLRPGAREADPPATVFAREVDLALRQEDGKQAAALVSHALRRYCGALHDFDGPGATSEETLRRLQDSIPTAEWQGLRRVLRSVDDLRWQPSELSAVMLRPWVDEARSWVAAVEQRLTAEAEEQREAVHG